MKFHSQKLLKIAALSLGLASLGGCSVLGGFWHDTKQFSQSKIAYIGSLLRPTPKQVAIFEPARRDNNPANSDFMQKYSTPITDTVPPTRYAMSHTIEEGVHVYRPGGHVQHIIKAPPQAIARPQTTIISGTNYTTRSQLRPASNPYPASVHRLAEPVQELAGAARTAEIPDLSYVKIGGGSDMTDWQNCQRENGQYMRPSGDGFQIDPGFDLCMRNKGYLTEQEALKVLQIKH